MNLKISKDLKRNLEEIAEQEFSTPEGVLRRGLIIYLMYLKHIDISQTLKGEKGIEEAEQIIINLSEEYNNLIDDIIFACIDAYRCKVIGMSIDDRLSLSNREYIYVFIDNPMIGRKLGIYKEEYKSIELSRVLAIEKEKNRIEQEKQLELCIEGARNKLKSLESELKTKNAEYIKANMKYTEVAATYSVLKATSIIKLTAKQRIDHKDKLEKKEAEFQRMSLNVSRLISEVEGIKKDIDSISCDIGCMDGMKSNEDINIGEFGKYRKFITRSNE